ncbi:hypothetical protein [Anthocerotibacter panamensis]|uniref:hypothetical protein n=1 Tax=Anthocerotibacter panamensis TaxID=2857077 RepID=UPI001C4062BC|nr:hypothetical protein [Anthocerotibacter panamensis]
MIAVGWEQLLGQPQAVSLLTRAITCARVVHGYLFHGPLGVGKALAARLFAQELLEDDHAQPLDLLWLEPTYRKGERLYTAQQARAEEVSMSSLPQVRLEQVHTAQRFLSRSPNVAPRRVVVIEGAETMGEPAANALLKTLEEPGTGVMVLTAHQGYRVLSTIRSRCQLIPFYRLREELLRALVGPEYPEDLLAMAQGSPGEAQRIYQQYQALPQGLLHSFFPWPHQPLPLMTLAREVDAALDLEAQLWLVDYLQQRLWILVQQGSVTAAVLTHLERLRGQLTRHVQPRLAWEVALIQGHLGEQTVC